MAKSRNNLMTKNYSGRVGDIILKNYGDLSVMTKRPDCSKVIRSLKQTENNNWFKKSVRFGKTANNNPKLIRYYNEHKKKERQSVYHAAISDYQSRAKIESVDLSNYQGMPGTNINIKAWHKWKLEQVTLIIMDETGYVIEKGSAAMSPWSGGTEWDYMTTTVNPGYNSCKFLVRVTEMTGKTAEAMFDAGGNVSDA